VAQALTVVAPDLAGSATSATTGSVSAPLPSPHLYFTDLTSGPRSGNRDTSKGQIANQNGAIVTVWGANLGVSQGTSTITLGGVTPTAIYYWGNATPPNCGPARLYNQYQKLQCIVFQVAGATPSGAQTIVATVNGVASNTLAFTVQTAGRIFYAGSCSSSCTGTFSNPFKTIADGMNALDRGDILYVKDNLSATGGVAGTANSRWDHGSLNNPITLAVYPGATSTLGSTSSEAFQANCSGCGYGLTWSKFSMLGNQNAITVAESSRVVGITLSCPNGASPTGCLAGFGSNLFILGNEITQAGTTNPGAWDPLYHVIYLGGRRSPCPCFLESGREIGWNYIHDNAAFRAINLFNGTGGDSNPISDHNIHDNVILNQEGDAILFGRGVVGVNSATNNLIINAGLSNVSNAPGGTPVNGSVCLDLQMSEAPAGGASVSHAPTVVTVSNNTLLNCGQTAGSNSFNGVIGYNTPVGTVTFRDNIFYQQAVNFAYTVGTPGGAITTNGSNNLWFGAGPAPTWDTNSVNSNPLLISATRPYDLHLQASSPAIGAGVNLTSRGVGLLDFDGRRRPTSGGWDIGAYQFSSAASGGAPTATTVGAATAAPASATSPSPSVGDTTAAPASVTNPTASSSTPAAAATLALSFNGRLRDRVGQGDTALGADGALDGTFTVTVSGLAGRTITALKLNNNDIVGRFDTVRNGDWVLGVALGLDSAMLNEPTTMAVNFAVADAATFVIFASDAANFGWPQFVPGQHYTLTASFSDGSAATATTTVP